MLEQLKQLVQQYGNEAVVNNDAVPNNHNEGVLTETTSSILTGLKGIAAENGGNEKISELLQANASNLNSNATVQQLMTQLSAKLGQKFGLSSQTSSGVAQSLIPQVLGSLLGNAKNPNYKGFEIADIIKAISSGSNNSGLMETISKYGTQFGLDQNNDNKIDVADAMAIVNKNGGIGGLFKKFFKK